MWGAVKIAELKGWGFGKCPWIRSYLTCTPLLNEWINKCKRNWTGMQNRKTERTVCETQRQDLNVRHEEWKRNCSDFSTYSVDGFGIPRNYLRLLGKKHLRSSAFHSGFTAAMSHFNYRRSRSQTDRDLVLFPSFSSSSSGLLCSCGALAVPVSSAYGTTQEFE